MVVVASSRSARTALPNEQNHPGRRLEHAAQPTGDCRLIGFWRTCEISTWSTSAMVLPPRAGDEAQSTAANSPTSARVVFRWKTLRAQMNGYSWNLVCRSWRTFDVTRLTRIGNKLMRVLMVEVLRHRSLA